PGRGPRPGHDLPHRAGRQLHAAAQLRRARWRRAAGRAGRIRRWRLLRQHLKRRGSLARPDLSAPGEEAMQSLSLRWRASWLALVLPLAAAAAQAADPNFEVLHHINLNDGVFVEGALVEGADGAFYGTARVGGRHNMGTVFRVLPDGTFEVLHNFRGGKDG